MGILTKAGLPDVTKLSRSSQNFQFFTGDGKMALCQLKPLHKICYVSIDQRVPGGGLMDDGVLVA